jgi:hypothetical protein
MSIEAMKQAVEALQGLLNYNYHGEPLDERDIEGATALGNLMYAIKQAEQAPAVEAVPAFWASENVFKESLRDNISCILTTTKCAANTVPLYTAPPAISEEIVYQVCRYTDLCKECWSWDDCDKEDYDKAHPTARRRVVILDEC